MTTVFLAGMSWSQAQTPPQQTPNADGLTPPPASARPSPLFVRNVSIEKTGQGLSLAIASNGALVPTITRMDGPPRLVIDLPGTANRVPQARIRVYEAEIKAIRMSEQKSPLSTRIVVDLTGPRDYVWETLPNKLLVHLRPHVEPAAQAKAPEPTPSLTVPSFTKAAEPVISAANEAAEGSVVLAGNRPASGSTITAGAETALLNLARGGQIRVCPQTTVSVTASKNGRDLMLSMSTGSLETHYALSTSSDSILTPDFRILLPGPGQFDLAFSADSHGDTCVRSLPGNTASAVVSELMGDGTYQVKPDEQVVFHSGTLSKLDHTVPIDCGCPPAQNSVMRAEAQLRPPITEVTSGELPAASPKPAPEERPLPPAAEAQRPPGVPVQVKMEVTPSEASQPVPKTEKPYVQIEAPLVFRGDIADAPVKEAEKLPPTSNPKTDSLNLVPLPPPSPIDSVQATQPSKPRTGFFGKIRHFLVSIFG
ncbi:MAG TPA: AMIN domain-containing protein [Terriglobales bacterium]|nr:AMIN domain-containing protein [Terriglobales bacterium]